MVVSKDGLIRHRHSTEIRVERVDHDVEQSFVRNLLSWWKVIVPLSLLTIVGVVVFFKSGGSNPTTVTTGAI